MECTILEKNDVLDGLTLTDLWRVIKRVEQHSSYFEERENLGVRRGTKYDEDDRSYGQWWVIRQNSHRSPKCFHDTGEDALWIVVIWYSNTSSEAADYEDAVSVGKSTAYRGYRGWHQKMGFAPVSGKLRYDTGEFPHFGSDVFSRLSEKCDYLDALQEDLAHWVQSGLDMKVQCFGESVCFRGPGLMTNAKLAEYLSRGWSLPQLRAKLACRECGQRNPNIFPA